MPADLSKCPNCGTQMDTIEDTDMQICPNCNTLASLHDGKLEWRVPEGLTEEFAVQISDKSAKCLRCGEVNISVGTTLPKSFICGNCGQPLILTGPLQ